MATVVNVPADRRPEAVGRGLGGIVAFLLRQRAKAKSQKKEADAIAKSVEIFQKVLRGGTVQEAVSDEDRSQAALLSGKLAGKPGPTKTSAGIMDAIPRTRDRELTSADVIAPLLEGGIDVNAAFALKLAEGVEEAKRSRVKEEAQSEAFNEIFEAAASEGAKRSDIIRAISTSELTATKKIQLLQNIDKFLPAEGEEDTIDIFAPGVEKATKVTVPEDVAGSLKARQEFVEKNFPGFSVTPPKKETSEGVTESMISRLTSMGVDPGIIDKAKLGLIKVVGPDQEGEVSIVDLTTNSIRRLGGDRLTPATLREIEQRVISLTDAITLLGRTDTKSVGLTKIFAAEVGGIAIQVPVIGSIAQALGYSEGEIAELQADRSDFFAVLGPLVQSFAQDGDRRSLATRTELGLAERILNMTRLSSTPGGADIQRAELTNLLTEIRARLIAQRLTRSVVPPSIVSPNYFITDDNKIGVQ